MNKEGKYNIVLIEPSEIVAAGIAAIINGNPKFAIVQTLSSPAYYHPGKSDIDAIIINPTVIDYNDRLDIRASLGSGSTAIIALAHSIVYCRAK